MKKTLLILTLCLATAFGAFAADSAKVPAKKISALVSEYSIYDGFDTVKIGSLGTTMLKGLMGMAGVGDKDAADALRFFHGIKKIAIVDYEDAASAHRDSFNAKVANALENIDVLMETKDEDSVMRIYGNYNENLNKVQDFVVFCPEDYTLILLTGSISLDALQTM